MISLRRLSLAATLAVTATLCASLSACARQPTGTGDTLPVVPPPPPAFTDAERAAIVAYWGGTGRYKITGFAGATTSGPYVVRLTPEASLWFRKYNNTPGSGAKKKSDTASATPDPTADWEPWIKAKVAYDNYQAQQTAQAANIAVFPGVIPPPTAPPPPPGAIPPSLLAACGNPPRFAWVYTPLQYTVTFDDGDAYNFTDNVKMGERSGAYRSSNGVVNYGQKLRNMPAAERDALFQAAGLTMGEQHVWDGVSNLEGGFDAVNSYDSGYVSVGFIQFITMLDGRHSLSDVLLEEKTKSPDDFQNDFRRYGIDLNASHAIVVVDPETGAELQCPDAITKIIDDKRLIAAFERAGRKTAFRVAQIRVAKQDYWPINEPVVVDLPNGAHLTGVVSDVIHSEAGIATLLDRKVNTGGCSSTISRAVTDAMIAHKCPGKSLAEALPYEREIVDACEYRTSYLTATNLTQPPAEDGVTPKAPNRKRKF